MRTIDSHQTAEVCHAIVDELRSAAAEDLTPAERRHLRAIAQAVNALVEAKPSDDQATEAAGEAVQAHPA